MNTIKALRAAPSIVPHHEEWKYAGLKWHDELKSTPGSITWDMLKDRLEQELKDLDDADPIAPAKKTTTPAGVALYTLAEASTHFDLPVCSGGCRGGGERGRGGGERGARKRRGGLAG